MLRISGLAIWRNTGATAVGECRKSGICYLLAERVSVFSSWNKGVVPADRYQSSLLLEPLGLLAQFPWSNPRFDDLDESQYGKRSDWIHLVPKITELTVSAHRLRSDFIEIDSNGPPMPQSDLDVDAWASWPPDASHANVTKLNFSAFENITRLHLYFADFENDEMLLVLLVRLKKLTHVRFSRPRMGALQPPSYDWIGVRVFGHLLRDPPGRPKMESVILQLDSKVNQEYWDLLLGLQDSEGRFQLVDTATDDTVHSGHYQYTPALGKDKTGLEGLIEDLGKTRLKPFADCILAVPRWIEQVTHWGTAVIGVFRARTGELTHFYIEDTEEDTDAKCEKLGFYQFAQRAGRGEGVWRKKSISLW